MTGKDAEGKLSQVTLAPAAEISIASPPIPSQTTLSASPEISAMEHNLVASSDKASLFSPLRPPSSSDMTPPPSSQALANAPNPFRCSRSESNSFLASPPATVDQTLCVAYGASEDLPSSRDIDNADETKVRQIAKDLLGMAQEFRMSAAHFKLQHSLLSFTSSEAVKRAEVEHQLARREVEILQSEEYRNRHGIGVARTPQPSLNSQLEAALRRTKELEDLNLTLERRLRRAKRLIEEQNDKYELLVEENTRLKKRIRDNREHFTLMLDHGSLASSPRTEFLTPQRKTVSRYPENSRSQVSRIGSQDPFAALLAADQVLSGEAASVPSTPTRNRNQKQHHGHARGTHSMSSLPATPSRSRPSQGHFFTPINKRTTESRLSYSAPVSQAMAEHAQRDRRDRDSTISASDVEEAVTDEDIPASQASSLATSMLRRYPGSSQEDVPISDNIGKSSCLLQTKLFGHIKKTGIDRTTDSLKRKPSSGDKDLALKKVRVGRVLEVGIET